MKTGLPLGKGKNTVLQETATFPLFFYKNKTIAFKAMTIEQLFILF